MLKINELRQIHLGIQGENLAREIPIDVSAWLIDFPNGSISIWHKRNGDSEPGPTGATLDREKGILTWSPTNTDTYYDGEGSAEVRLTEDGVIKKTREIKTDVSPAVTLAGTTQGSDWQSYINAVEEIKDEAVAAAADAAEAAEEAVEGIIDDTAGEGDTDKVWSADKVTGELAGKTDEPETEGTDGQVLATDGSGGRYWKTVESGGGGTSNYSDLTNKPQIGGVTLVGNKSLSDLGIATEEDVTDLLSAINGKVDEPASEGTNGQVLTTDGNGGRSWTTVQGGGTDHGVPSGGSTNQVLAKNSNTDYDLKWVNQSGGGSSDTEVKNSTKTGIDLDVSDASGNVVMRLMNGHLQTKNFASHISPSTQVSGATADLDFSDENGNVILRVKNGNIVTKRFNSSGITENVVTVKTDGSGNYTSIRDAVESITDASAENPYRIEVYPGTYDVLSDYTQEEIEEADVPDYHDGFPGLMLSDGVSLVGVGNRDKIIILGTLDPTEYNSQIRGNISTLNIQGNGRLENLTVVCKYIRYCVHDDFEWTAQEQYNRVVRNCRFDMQRNTNTSSDDNGTPPNSYGAGTKKSGMISLFENCDFSTGLGIHTNSNLTKPTRHIVKNCRGYAFRPNDRNENIHSEFIVDDCAFDIIKYGHYTDSTKQVFNIHGTGNKGTKLNCSATDNINIGDKTRHKNTMNLPVLTMVKRDGSTFARTTDPVLACGIITLIEGEYVYIQRWGYISSTIMGMTGLSLGDYITVDSNGALTTTGASASNAVGVITHIDDSVAYMKMLVGEV